MFQGRRFSRRGRKIQTKESLSQHKRQETAKSCGDLSASPLGALPAARLPSGLRGCVSGIVFASLSSVPDSILYCLLIILIVLLTFYCETLKTHTEVDTLTISHAPITVSTIINSVLHLDPPYPYYFEVSPTISFYSQKFLKDNELLRNITTICYLQLKKKMFLNISLKVS